MIRIAITGGIACGKSLVGDLLAKAGVPVSDADHLAHDLMTAGSPIYQDVIDAFGREILAADGQIDRTVLGRLVFSAEEARAKLNALVHPAVQNAWTGWLTEMQTRAVPAAAVLVPLLFEAGMAAGWDTVMCVACSRRVQMERLEARGWTGEESAQRIDAQAPVAWKMERADIVLFNDGEKSLLRRQVEIVLRQMLGADYGQ